ncbi:hypothetical protein [Actinomadura livida]|uniref:Heme A synthase n=1 Tax=Actinomadura livida TaxID=79909 RepID=A0A7W7N1G7_9ACTN|nr:MULTISPECIES: hypothetical protein [Actinomadura]MBB4778129.1 heme A synthase [Actinomadura catellatispora]GGU29018.1 hypothetical protein GCM10010208_62190 [Actinomadura livida]
MAERHGTESGMTGAGTTGTGTTGRRRHRFDPAGPVTGLFFLVLAGLFLAEGLSDERVLAPEVLAPVVLIGLGLVGIVRVLTRSRRRHLR